MVFLIFSCGFLQPGESSLWHPNWVLYTRDLSNYDCGSQVCIQDWIFFFFFLLFTQPILSLFKQKKNKKNQVWISMGRWCADQEAYWSLGSKICWVLDGLDWITVRWWIHISSKAWYPIHHNLPLLIQHLDWILFIN